MNSNSDHGQYLYSVAIVADTHLNQSDNECNSPFDVNRLANNRLRYVIEDLNKRDLAMVIHLGDIVHPVPSMDDLYTESAQQFFGQFARLKHPFHLIPGNHDVGDKPLNWGPAGTVRDSFLDAWSKNFGDHYFHHEHRGIHFVGLNTQLPGSGLAMEAEQAEWLRETLDKIRGQRIFICSHYPPYLFHPDEPEHYDNLGSRGRDWLLSTLSEYRVEGLFCGHVHQYWFHQYDQTRCHLLPSTAFTRQDYSEMFRVSSNDEFGRNDVAKLGYMLLHLFEHDHGIEVVRTAGEQLTAATREIDVANIHKPPGFCGFRSALGFDMRPDWFETVQIPPSGGLDEFDRKLVRNDYGLLALLDMGIRKLRLPVADLLDLHRRSRLIELQGFGFSYAFYSFGVPAAKTCQVISEMPSLIASWTVCCRIDELDDLDGEFLACARNNGIELIFSPLRSKQELIDSGQQYYHVINHGFTTNDFEMLRQWHESPQGTEFDRYLLRLAFDQPVDTAFDFVKDVFASIATPASIQLRLSADNPASKLNDAAWQCRRLTHAMLYGHASLCGEFYCDTFTDIDRGYFPRAGLLDRRYNPREGMQVVQQVNTLLAENDSDTPLQTSDGLLHSTADNRLHFAVPTGNNSQQSLADRIEDLFDSRFNLQQVNLVTGASAPITSASQLSGSLESGFPLAIRRRDKS